MSLETRGAECEDSTRVARGKRDPVGTEQRRNADIIFGKCIRGSVVGLDCLDKITIPLRFWYECKVFPDLDVALRKRAVRGSHRRGNRIHCSEIVPQVL